MKELNTFLRTATLFSLPILLVLAFPIFVLFKTGELSNAEDIVATAQIRPVLVGSAYLPTESERFRILSFMNRKPQVVVLGNSRSLQIRSEFFKSDVPFFNLGIVPGRGVLGYQRFIEQLPKSHVPDVIIVPLDPSDLVAEFDNNTDGAHQNFFRATIHYPPDYLWAFGALYKQFVLKKYTLGHLFEQNEAKIFGMNGRVNKNGYRTDGSFNYGRVLKDPESSLLVDHAYSNTLGQMRAGVSSFVHATTVPQTSYEDIRTLIRLADTRNIHLVVYFPPFTPTIYSLLKEEPARYGYIEEAAHTLMDIFKNSSHSFNDFSDPSLLGYTDEGFIDGYHPSERLDAQTLLRIAEDDALLASYLKEDTLKQKLTTESDSRTLFPVSLPAY